MKRILIFILLTICFCARSANVTNFIAGNGIPGGSAITSTASGGGGGGYTYFLTENFEATGYDTAGWSTFGGTPDPDYSTSGLSLEGSQCLHLNAAASQISINKSDIYGYFQIRILTHTASVGTRQIFIGYNSTAQFGVGIDGTRHLYVSHGNGGPQQSTSDTVSDTTTYNVWFEYHKGTGANGTASACFSTTTTKPTSGSSFCSVSTGTATVNLTLAVLYSDGSSVHKDCAIDKFRLSDSNIGDNPN